MCHNVHDVTITALRTTNIFPVSSSIRNAFIMVLTDNVNTLVMCFNFFHSVILEPAMLTTDKYGYSEILFQLNEHTPFRKWDDI